MAARLNLAATVEQLFRGQHSIRPALARAVWRAGIFLQAAARRLRWSSTGRVRLRRAGGDVVVASILLKMVNSLAPLTVARHGD